MTSEQLKHFLYTCKYMSFTEAAERLYLHPTSVSRSVSSLEKELQVTLFERKHRGLSLTSAGEYFISEAEKILLMMENTSLQVRSIGLQANEKLSIRIPLNYFSAVSTYCREFLYTYPSVMLDLDFYMPVDGFDVCRQLDDGTIDLYLGYSDNIPAFSVSAYSLRKLRTDKVVAVCGLNHPFADRDSITLADISGQTVYSSDFHNSDLEDTIISLMKEQGLDPAIRSTPCSESEMFMHVSAGQGITFFMDIPRAVVPWECKCVSIDGLDYQKDLFMVWSNKHVSTSLQKFLDITSNPSKYPT